MTTAEHSSRPLRERFPRLVNANGALTMVADDQRESLRSILARDRPVSQVPDQDLVGFKRDVLRILTPHASAVLLDRQYGLAGGSRQAIAPGCGLIVAADILEQKPGELVTGSRLDHQVTPEFLHQVGADAVKLLVIWKAGTGHEEERELVEEFLDLARRTGVTSLVEGIARPATGTEWSSPQARNEAVERTAIEINELHPDIYKAEVPGYALHDVSGVEQAARRLTASIDSPWVVLSSGVASEDFEDAVAAAVAGGASGFLAGRGIWAMAASAQHPRAVLERESVPRLDRLVALAGGKEPADA